jgi:two-component system, response regulator YesN
VKYVRAFFGRIFLLVTLGIVASLLVLTVAVYVSARANLMRLMSAAEARTLEQTTFSARLMSEYVIQVALQLFSDEVVENALNGAAFSRTEFENIKDKLDSIANITPFIQSLYVYNPAAGKIFVGSPLFTLYPAYDVDTFYDSQALRILDNPKDYRAETPIVRSIVMPAYSHYLGLDVVSASVYSFVFRRVPWSRQAVVINVNRTWMEQTIADIDQATVNRSIVVNAKDGRIVADSASAQPEAPDTQTVAEEEYFRAIVDGGASEGSLIIASGVGKNLVVYRRHDPLDWLFIRIVPFPSFMRDTNRLVQNLLIISAVILTLGLGLSWLISRRLYQPFYATLTRLFKLEEEHTRSQLIAKGSFLRGILLGQKYGELTAADPLLDGLRLNVDLDQPQQLLLFTIDGFPDAAGGGEFERRSVLSKGVAGIVSREVGAVVACETVEMQENLIAVILSLKKQPVREGPSPQLEGIMRRIREAAADAFGVTLSVTIGPAVKDHRDLAPIYSRCLEESMRRVYLGYDSTIFSDAAARQSEERFQYPFQIEKRLVEALFAGSLDEARAQLRKIVEASTQYAYSVFLTAMIQLTYAIKAALNDAAKYSRVVFETNVHEFVDTLKKLDTLDAIEDHFSAFFRTILLHLDLRKEQKHATLVEKVERFITGDYANPNLSLEMMADMVHLSAGHLSQIFRHHSGQSMPDYIRNKRLNHAIELMRSSRDTLDNIARQSGFPNTSYFYRAFKRQFGVTPAEFRAKLAAS